MHSWKKKQEPDFYDPTKPWCDGVIEYYDGCNKLPTELTGVSLRNLIINISKAASNGKQKDRGMHGAFLNFTTNSTKKHQNKNSSDVQCLLEQQGGPCRRTVCWGLSWFGIQIMRTCKKAAADFGKLFSQKAKNEATGRFFHT